MGMWQHALKAVWDSDVILEILDARLPDLTRNRDLETRVRQQKKRLIFVLNKSDLISKETALEAKKKLEKMAPTIFVSGTKKKGIIRLRVELQKILKSKPAKIAIVGYPNTGKSTILNALAGRKAAKTSAQAGFTRGRSFVKLNENQYLVDSPGVISFEQRNEFELALMSAKNPNQLRDKEGVALELAQWIGKKNPDALQKTYDVEWKNDPESFLDALAIKKKKLQKGGTPDVNTIASMLILDWQNGKIRI